MRALCPLKVKLTARGEQAGGRERSAEWRCQQLEAVAARAGLAVPDAGEQGSDTPGDSSAVGSEVDSPGSWWAPHEGGWIKPSSHDAPHPPGPPGAQAAVKGEGASPASSGGTLALRDSTDWGKAHGSWHAASDHHAAGARRVWRGGGGGGAQGRGIPGVSAEAADDWHHDVRLRAQAALVPGEVPPQP